MIMSRDRWLWHAALAAGRVWLFLSHVRIHKDGLKTKENEQKKRRNTFHVNLLRSAGHLSKHITIHHEKEKYDAQPSDP